MTCTIYILAPPKHSEAIEEFKVSYEENHLSVKDIKVYLDIFDIHKDRMKQPKDTARDFFENWFQYVDPLPETWEFIKELKARGVPIYLLSNASTRFAERAPEDYPILKEFDGIVFSAPLKMAKPGHDIYYHLFNKYDLLPSECFFIDDTVENVIASKELGMESILFTGDIEAVKRAIEF